MVDLYSPDTSGGNKLWFCWWNPDFGGGYHREGYPDYAYVAQNIADNTETEVAGHYYDRAASYNTKPKLQIWTYWFSSTCAILMEITN